MKISDDFKLNVVSVRLVKEAPILSDINRYLRDPINFLFPNA